MSDISLKLGMVDNPSASDDAVNLNFLNAAGKGYQLKPNGLKVGQPYQNQYGVPVRDLTILLDVEGTDRQDLIKKFRNVQRYLTKTRLYYDKLGGTYPSRSDNKGHQGQTAVLTMQLSNASKRVYWDVMGDSEFRLPEAGWVGDPMSDISLLGCILILQVEAYARGERVLLNNLVGQGDFAPPVYDGAPTILNNNWTALPTISYNNQTSPDFVPPKFGDKVGYTQNGTFSTNDCVEYLVTDKLVPSIWLYYPATLTTGTTNVKFEGWNGSAWVTLQTLINITAYPTPNVWKRFDGVAQVMTGYTKCRLTQTLTTLNGFAYFTGLAIWRNPANDLVPDEYCSGGDIMRMTSFNVYGVQGDVPAPVKLRIENWSSSATERYYIVGKSVQNLGQTASPTLKFITAEKPIFPLDVRSVVGTTTPALIWGTLGATSSGAGTTSAMAISPESLKFYDRRPRLYRAFLAYVLNDQVTASAVTLSFYQGGSSNGPEVKTFNVTLPATYAGAAAPAAANCRLFELGDFMFSRPGNTWEEKIYAFYSGSTFITITHTSNANRQCAIQGLILIPKEQYASVDLGAAAGNLAIELNTESGVPRVAVDASSVQVGGVGEQLFVELSSYNSSGLLTGGEFYLNPADVNVTVPDTITLDGYSPEDMTCNRFEILMASAKATNGLLTYDATSPKHVWLEYTPLYAYGAA